MKMFTLPAATQVLVLFTSFGNINNSRSQIRYPVYMLSCLENYHLCDANHLLLCLAVIFSSLPEKIQKTMNTWWQLMCFREWMVFTQHEFHPAVQQIQISKVTHISELWLYWLNVLHLQTEKKESKRFGLLQYSTNDAPLLFRNHLTKLPHCHLDWG